MKLALFTAPNKIEIQRRAKPSVAETEVLLRVLLCGICGSDLAGWQGKGHASYPFSLGHEYCGIIEKVGGKVANYFAGQKVVIDPNLSCGTCHYCRLGKPNLCDELNHKSTRSNGGFSDFVSLFNKMVHPLPDLFPVECAPFIEPLSCALHAVRIAKPRPEESIVVTGLGIMGILVGRLLQDKGCYLIFVEPMEKRQQFAKKLFKVPSTGVSVIAPKEVETSQLVCSVDVVIECSGNANALSQGVKILRKAGRLALTGLVFNTEEVPIPLDLVTSKELTLLGTWLNPNTFEEAVTWAVKNMDFLKMLKTKTFKLAEIRKAFNYALSAEVTKVLVSP